MTAARDRFLVLYLQDHLAAATGGVGLARRALVASAGRDGELHEFYGELEQELTKERAVLIDALALLGARPDRAKIVTAGIVERLGRLKPNLRVMRRSPYSDLVELEGLSIAVQGKRFGWIVLADRAHPKLAVIDADRLIERAEHQSYRLDQLRRSRGARVLATTGTTVIIDQVA